MFSDLLFSNFSYEIKYHVSYIKQNSSSLVTTCKRSHVDKMNDAPVGPFRVPIDLNKNPVFIKLCSFSVCLSIFFFSHTLLHTYRQQIYLWYVVQTEKTSWPTSMARPPQRAVSTRVPRWRLEPGLHRVSRQSPSIRYWSLNFRNSASCLHIFLSY